MLDNKIEEQTQDIKRIMLDLGKNAHQAAEILASTTEAAKNEGLNAMADTVLANTDKIQTANKIDMANGEKSGLSDAFMDRLELTDDRILAMASGLRDIAKLNDPVGNILDSWDRPNGLQIARVSTPLGVIGVIYESRPNVTADAGALCLKAGNAVILRGGSDSFHSSNAIHACMIEGLKQAGLPIHAIQMVPTTDRSAVGEMLSGLAGNIDVIVPRGGKGLVARVQKDARVPVFAHLEGICHVYIDKSAELEMATQIVLNSKMRRTGICGSAETLLIDADILDSHLAPILNTLHQAGCTIRGDETVAKQFKFAQPASLQDWKTEYLDTIISVRVVNGIEGAIEHISKYSSNHTEAIIAEDKSVVGKFFAQVDSAILLHNASTQFADGAEFGMGAEIGIATGKMHARGPVGVEQLTSFKYLVRGQGQIRP